ncbi:hypothetical protein ACWGDT_23265 [Streptomyces avermitilis]
MDLVAIQQLLGHWTVSSTMRYVRPSARFIEDAYRCAVTTTLGELAAEEAALHEDPMAPADDRRPA